MNDIISKIAERNLDHIIEEIFWTLKPKDILNLAHTSRHHRSLVDNFELLPFSLSQEEDESIVNDDFEDQIDKGSP